MSIRIKISINFQIKIPSQHYENTAYLKNNRKEQNRVSESIDK